jgi:hypothetical protein
MDKYKTGSDTYETGYIKDSNVVAVSPGGIRGYRCIQIIDIESKEVMITIPMDTTIYVMALEVIDNYCLQIMICQTQAFLIMTNLPVGY